ncbi:MAG: hypothetical protein WA708_19125 [Acidobacteriaceae bacterium]
MPFPASLVQTLQNYHLQPYPSFTGLPQPITAGSIAHFLAALFWACLLLVSLTGWGRMTGKLFRVQSLPAAPACALGIAAVVLLGGLLNLFHAIYAGVLIGIVAIGLLLYFLSFTARPENYEWMPAWNSASRWTKLLVVATLLILVCRVAATVRLREFRVDDDASAYLVYPQKMLASHQFARDPFSDRRIISSLGGAYLLQACILAPTSLSHIGMADRTLGLILLFAALFDLGTAFGLSLSQIAWMELIVYLIPQPTFNLTFQILPVALFMAMIWMIFQAVEQEQVHRWRYAVSVGAIGGAIISLKSTFLPYVGALALLPFLLILWRRNKPQAWMLPLVAGMGALLVLAAWMVAMKQASGTWLFPILGHGFDYSSYDLFRDMPKFDSSKSLLRITLQGILLLILAAISAWAGNRTDNSRLGLSVLLAAALAITALNYESGGDYIWRYNFPQFFSAVIVFFAAQSAAADSSHLSRRSTAVHIAAWLALICCIFYYDLEGGKLQPFREMATEVKFYRSNLRAGLSRMQLVSPAVRDEYLAVESALPGGAVALDVTTNSFLLQNRAGRRFLLDDWPGAASPPPGWPFTRNPQSVPIFLLQNSVRYVVYGYDFADWYDMQSCQSFLGRPHLTKVDHALELLEILTHHQLDSLRASHTLLYDDGKIAVIDLQSPLSSVHTSVQPWTLASSEAEMCSQITHRYISAHPPTPQDNMTSE